MGNDNKYVRLYPERAVALAREVLQLVADREGEVFAVRAGLALGNLDSLGFPPDEPLFLLRGQDELAHPTVRFYSREVRMRPGAFGDWANRERVADHLWEFAAAMERWTPRKMPD